MDNMESYLANIDMSKVDWKEVLAVFDDPQYARHNLSDSERFWVNLQPFLLSKGYSLRPRYDPNWKPSWLSDKGEKRTSITEYECEDSLKTFGSAIDATRISDGQKVVLKKVPTDTQELSIAMYFSSPAQRKDPRNHIVPILDVILVPADDDWALLVMPMLLEFQHIPFRRVGEFAEAALQYLQGLELMHEHNIVHRDLCLTNLMMDASKIVPRGWHFARCDTHDGVDTFTFKHRDRWFVKPIQYYVIDFDISLKLPRKQVLTKGVWGRDKTVPEMSRTAYYDPFAVDVYQLGNVLLKFTKTYEGLGMFSALAKRMTDPVPAARPSAGEAARICKEIISKCGYWRLSRRIWLAREEYHPYGWFIERILIKFCGWNTTLV